MWVHIKLIQQIFTGYNITTTAWHSHTYNSIVSVDNSASKWAWLWKILFFLTFFVQWWRIFKVNIIVNTPIQLQKDYKNWFYWNCRQNGFLPQCLHELAGLSTYCLQMPKWWCWHNTAQIFVLSISTVDKRKSQICESQSLRYNLQDIAV